MRTKLRWGASARRRLSVAVGAVVLAFGAIVLARAPHMAAAVEREPSPAPPGSTATRAVIESPELSGFLAFTQGAVLEHGTRELFAELRLTAAEQAGDVARRPVALAVVLDTSGSMMGEKIVAARRSVHELLARMRPDDQIAIVTYDYEARVLSPLTRVGDARHLHAAIDRIEAGGGTNIPAGLALGAGALGDASSDRVRRLVLISDGIDGSGLDLGAVQHEVVARAQGGTTTSALGVGSDYDERWLTTVADAGRGNYEFLARGGELAGFLRRELDQASTTVASMTALELSLPSGWRLADVYGATAEGSRVPLGALYAGERRRVTLRFEVEAQAAGQRSELASTLRYRANVNETDRNLPLARLSVNVVGDEAQVTASTDVALHAEAIAQHIDRRQLDAIQAWRDGRTEEAQALARDNIERLQGWSEQAPSAAPALRPRMQAAQLDLGNFDQMDSSSAEGRAYGLQSNGSRRARARSF